MLNDICQAVMEKLRNLYGAEADIAMDSPGLKSPGPSFRVGLSEMSQKQIIGQRYFRENGMYLRYVPDPEQNEAQAECCQVLDVLTDGLEYITLPNGDLLRGIRMNGQVKDGVLTFYVSYNLFLNKQKEQQESMEALNGHAVLKGEV